MVLNLQMLQRFGAIGFYQEGRMRQMEDAPIIRERLWELFKLSGAANVTQFAKMLGMNRQSVDRYLNSERNPDAPSIIQICEKMNVSADWILGRSDIRS